MPDKPLRGAAPVKKEFDVGFDARFERRWLRVAIVGRFCLGAVVAAGLAGLLGSGPFSHRNFADPSGTVKVDFEPIARYGTSNQITVHLDMRRLAEAPEVTVNLSGVFLEPMGFHQVLHEPLREATDGDGLALTFPAGDPAQADALIRLMLSPTGVGPLRMTVRVGSTALQWQRVILP